MTNQTLLCASENFYFNIYFFIFLFFHFMLHIAINILNGNFLNSENQSTDKHTSGTYCIAGIDLEDLL